MNQWLYRVSLALVIVGLLVSIYMTIYKFTSNETMCLGSGDCSTVNSSRYAQVNGVPVAVIGLAGYGAILAVHVMERQPGFFKENGALMIFGLSLTGFLFTVYLIYIEAVILKAYCPFCITSQVAMTIIFIISITRLIRLTPL